MAKEFRPGTREWYQAQLKEARDHLAYLEALDPPADEATIAEARKRVDMYRTTLGSW